MCGRRNSGPINSELKCLDLEELWNSNLQDCTPKSTHASGISRTPPPNRLLVAYKRRASGISKHAPAGLHVRGIQKPCLRHTRPGLDKGRLRHSVKASYDATKIPRCTPRIIFVGIPKPKTQWCCQSKRSARTSLQCMMKLS